MFTCGSHIYLEHFLSFFVSFFFFYLQFSFKWYILYTYLNNEIFYDLMKCLLIKYSQIILLSTKTVYLKLVMHYNLSCHSYSLCNMKVSLRPNLAWFLTLNVECFMFYIMFVRNVTHK